MSRVGKRPIKLKPEIEVDIEGKKITFISGSNKIELSLPENLSAVKKDQALEILRSRDDKESRSLHGLYARLAQNAIEGLSQGITKNLEFKGSGYRARTEGDKLILNMGYSHEVELEIPKDVKVSVGKSSITITGHEAQVVGNFAANIREVRKPEVYKGKGIKYSDETIKRKDGKAAQSGKV